MVRAFNRAESAIPDRPVRRRAYGFWSSHHTRTVVPEPRVEIVGGPELYIDRGSRANLTCVITKAHKVPKHVRWTHDNKVRTLERESGQTSQLRAASVAPITNIVNVNSIGVRGCYYYAEMVGRSEACAARRCDIWAGSRDQLSAQTVAIYALQRNIGREVYCLWQSVLANSQQLK